MKLINKTKWSSQDLRKLCLAVIKHKGSHKNHTIMVQTRKSHWNKEGGLGGEARLYGSWIQMKVPKNFVKRFAGTIIGLDGTKTHHNYEKVPVSFPVDNFARVLEHEIDHNLGLHHNVMSYCWDKDVSYTNGFLVRAEPEKTKAKIDLVASRRDKAIKKVALFEKEIKRKSNLLKKWQKKVKYYLKNNN